MGTFGTPKVVAGNLQRAGEANPYSRHGATHTTRGGVRSESTPQIHHNHRDSVFKQRTYEHREALKCTQEHGARQAAKSPGDVMPAGLLIWGG